MSKEKPTLIDTKEITEDDKAGLNKPKTSFMLIGQSLAGALMMGVGAFVYGDKFT